MTLIKTNREWEGGDNLAWLHQDDLEDIRDLLLGHKVEKIAHDHLQLDNGTVMKVVGHQGGCSCGAGDYDLTDLNGIDNVITAVSFNSDPAGEEFDGQGIYEVFVMAEHKKVRLLAVEGSDGNGYYGTGYTILVRKP